MTESSIISLNFRGTIVQFDQNLLLKIPKTAGFCKYLQDTNCATIEDLLTKSELQGLLLNRSVYLFSHILDYWEFDQLHFPHCLCVKVIVKELEFWGISCWSLAACCADRLLLEEDELDYHEKIGMNVVIFISFITQK